MKKKIVHRVEFKRNGEACHKYLVGEFTKEQLAAWAERNDAAVTKALKCYPINMQQNQHNFELISNICANEMCDMDDGVIPYNAEEYAMLQKAKADAERFFCSYGMFNSPISWFVWDDWKRAKELMTWAVNHRMDACERAGIPYIG